MTYRGKTRASSPPSKSSSIREAAAVKRFSITKLYKVCGRLVLELGVLPPCGHTTQRPAFPRTRRRPAPYGRSWALTNDRSKRGGTNPNCERVSPQRQRWRRGIDSGPRGGDGKKTTLLKEKAFRVRRHCLRDNGWAFSGRDHFCLSFMIATAGDGG